MNISSPFIHRPVATTLLTVAVAFAGLLAYQELPVSPLPQVDFPTIQVSAALPGASPETMASSVAAPLERQFARIAALSEMTSSSNLGSTSIVLQFDLSRDIDAAARDVQAAINAARAQLPPGLPNNPTYRKVNPADAPVMILALTSETVDQPRMYDAASSILQQRLAQTEGVGLVNVGGSSPPAVRVDVNPVALNGSGLSLEDVRQTLGVVNVNRPKGSLEHSGQVWQISTTDQLLKASEYQHLVVSFKNGAGVFLSDIANVTDSVEDIRTLGLVNGKPAIPIVVFREPGANIIATADRVRALMPVLQASISPAIHLAIVLDRTTTIRESVRDVGIALGLAVCLVILVVFVFLKDVRTTMIPSIAVPVSLIGTLSVMYLAGYSLDNLSLMALAVATGFVVDDAIVVIENVTRYLEQGKTPLDAALQGAKEIGFTVVAITLSLVAAFTPILLMGGIVGRLFREFAITLSASIGVSMLVSLTTTPMLCARLLRAEGATGEAQRGRFYRASEQAFRWVLDLYESTLSWVLRHQPLMLLVTAATIALTVYLYFIVPKGFFPQQDNGRLLGMIQADQNTSFQAMSRRLTQFVKIVREDPAVSDVIAFTGGGGTINSARMFVVLKPLSERKAGADQVVGRLRNKLKDIAGATLFLQAVQDVRAGGRLSSAQYQYTLRSDDLNELIQWTPRLVEKLRTLPGLADVNTDQQNRGLEIALQIDRDSASRLGITAQAIDNTLYDAFGQRQVSTIYRPLNQYHVVLSVDPRFWQSPESLKYIYLPTTNGQSPLSAFATYERSATPLSVNHQGQFPSMTVSFNLLPGVSLGDAVAKIEQAERDLLMPETVQGTFSGTAQAYQQSLANMPLLILGALLAVYIVLGVLYESLIHPITILSTLPSAGVGALLAILLFRIDLSIMTFIGIILLIGIVKKNAILMIDFALAAERNEQKSPVEAISQACMLRFRPIVMTTMAAILGAVPLALGFGAGAELRRPLGVAIIGGLIFSQLLTLYTTPVVYLYLDRLAIRLRRRSLMPRFGLPSILILFMFALSACTVGPKYRVPSAPVTPTFKEPPPEFREAEGWKEGQPQDELARGTWWEIFGDPQLNALEEQVNISNQTIAMAEAQFQAARAQIRVVRSGLFPTLSVSANGTAASVSSNRLIGTSGRSGTATLYTIPFVFSWEADVWGRVRSSIKAQIATTQATAADLETARLSVHSELASDYLQLRGIDEEQRLFESTVTAFEATVRLTNNLYAQGVVSGVDVAQAETQLETARAQMIDLGVARAQFEHAIATLIGKPPAELTIPRDTFVAVPPPVPAGLPSELLERRPDIAAAERRVASANAQIGVAKAAYFPAITLSATGGFVSSAISTLLSWPSRFWSIGPSVAETIFDGGQRRAVVAQTQALYDSTVAAYRQDVLTAFQDVEDNLAALRILAEEAVQWDTSIQAAQRSVDLSMNRYRGGVASYLDVVVAQRTLLANQRSAIDTKVQRMTASVLLIKAIGGGWNSSELPTAKSLK